MDFGLWITKGAAILTFHSDFGMTHFEALGFPKDVKRLVATNSALLEEEESTADEQEGASCGSRAVSVVTLWL